MNINTLTVGQVTVVAPSGPLDGPAAAEVREDIDKLLPQHRYLVIDLSATTFVSSSSLRTMLLIYRQAQALGHTVAVVGLTPEIHNVLDATGFLDFFLVADTVDDGVAMASARAASAGEAREEHDREYALSGA